MIPLPSSPIPSSEGLDYLLVRYNEAQAEVSQPLSDAQAIASTESQTAKLIPANTNSKRIQKTSAKQIAEKAMKERVSRRVLLANRAENLTCACEVTGIVSQLLLPQIPFNKINQQRIVTTVHPLSRIENARGVAQSGIDYLRKLDTNVLAGVLLVLADEYELFRYSVGDSGVQKNAILRVAGKDQIIDTILMIEDLIHSGNSVYLPKLSMILDSDMMQGAMAGRLQSWTKLVAETIYAAGQRDEEDEFYAAVPQKQIKPQYIRDAEKAEKAAKWANLNKKWEQQRAFQADKKTAIAALKVLVTGGKVSSKLAQMLKGIFSDDTLLTISSEMKALLVNKLSDFGTPQADTLVSIIKAPRPLLVAKVLSLDDDEEEDIIPASQGEATALSVSYIPPVDPVAVESNSDESDNSEADDTEEENPLLEGQIRILIDNVPFNVNEAEWNAKSSFEKLKHKMALKAKFPEYFQKG